MTVLPAPKQAFPADKFIPTKITAQMLYTKTTERSFAIVQYIINGEAAFVIDFYLANRLGAWEDCRRQMTSYVSGAAEEKVSAHPSWYVPGGEVSQNETEISNNCDSVGCRKPVRDGVG